MLYDYLNTISSFVNSVFTLLYGFSAGSAASSLGSLVGIPGWTPAQIISGTIESLIRRLPDGGNFPQGVHDAAIYFGNRLNLIDFILPVDVLLGCMLLIFSTKFILWAFHIVKWITNFVRGVPTERFDGGMLPEDGPGSRYIYHNGSKMYL